MSRDKNEWERRAGPSDAGMRLDAFWARELEGEGISRGKVQEWIREGRATVDQLTETKPKYKVGTGAVLGLSGGETACGAAPEHGPLDVLYEDEHLVVLNKPAGLTTHPAPSQPDGTLVNRLVARYPEMCGMDQLRPGIVHRLDKDTSGVMVAARREKARLALAADFAERRVDKLYLALAHGVPEEAETDIDLPLGRHPRSKTRMAVVEKGGRPAKSRVSVLWSDPAGRMSLLAVRIFTGRTHQVRVHLAALGHPLLGDQAYGPDMHGAWRRVAGPAADLCTRQMLHAYTLCFDHPESGERLTFVQPPPEDFMRLLLACNEHCLRVGITGAAGSGKSALAGLLAELGAPVFSADACVAQLYAPGGDGAQMLAARYGGAFELPGGGVDKKALLAAMRDSEGLRREVMEMIHPMVRHRMEQFFLEHAAAPAAFAEIPLLLETGWAADGDDGLDLVVGVDCPEEQRSGARRRSRGMDPEVLALLDSWQWPAEKKLAACDVVVDNSGSLDDLRAGASALLERIGELRRERAAAFRAEVDAMLDSVAHEMAGDEDGEDA